MKINFFLILFFVINIISGSTPFNFSLSYHGGYDNNVMRFSDQEMNNASLNKSIMGSASTFDSYINKVNLRLNKSLFQIGKKELFLSTSYSLSNYMHNPNKDYWSGNIGFTYKWGAYKNIKYLNQHLNSYYLRHYIDRDISKDNLKPCNFSDRNQSLLLTLPLKKRVWWTIGTGFLQRYYDNPFTEFDLDINYYRMRINSRIKKVGTVGFQLDRYFANNITYIDIADMWIHEGFTAYSENLFLDYHYGKQAGADYTIGTRKGIQNDKPIIGPYNVNKNGSKDMYSKGANLLHTIRQITNNDELWRKTLRGLNERFYHKTVSSIQVEEFISESIGLDLKYVFNQYLRDVRIPIFEYKIDENGLNYRWSNSIDNFDMPLDIELNGEKTRLYPKNNWIEYKTKVNTLEIDRNFYVETKKKASK